MSRSRALDDDLLLRIFSKVGCADEIAKFALVSKRWRGLSYAVSYLKFEFVAATKKELRTQEGIVSRVLCRASSRAPGNLKRLRVSFTCREEAAEVHGHWLWLLCTTMASLTTLNLIAATDTVEWGPGVWNFTMRMKTLEELSVHGTFNIEEHLLLPQVLENGLQMAGLQYCDISYGDNMSVALLETIFATCPALSELRVRSEVMLGDALRVASSSLKVFSLSLEHFDRFEVTVHAPKLKTLNLLLTGSKLLSIYFESAQSLQMLSVEPRYKLCNPPETLRELTLSGMYDFQQLSEMLMLTPMITDLYLDEAEISGEGKRKIDILAPLVNLRNVYFNCEIWDFRAGERKFEALNVHLFPKRPCAPKVCWLKALIEVHQIQSLVVHCKRIVDYQTKAIRTGYEEWRFLFELSYFYPDRVKFVSAVLYPSFII